MRAFGYTSACRRPRFRHEARLSHIKASRYKPIKNMLAIVGTNLGRGTLSIRCALSSRACSFVVRSGSDWVCFFFHRGREYDFESNIGRRESEFDSGMRTHSSSNRTWSCDGEVGSWSSVEVEAEGRVSTTDVIIIVLVVFVAVVDVVDDGEQKGKR
jgi:hypothetical protein